MSIHTDINTYSQQINRSELSLLHLFQHEHSKEDNSNFCCRKNQVRHVPQSEKPVKKLKQYSIASSFGISPNDTPLEPLKLKVIKDQ